MKTTLCIVLLFAALLVGGCSTDRYDEGYEDGHEAGLSLGRSEGQEIAYRSGLSEGYDQGYAAGFAAANPNSSLSDTETVGAIGTSLRVFTFVFYVLIIVGLLGVVGYLLLMRHSQPAFVAAKVLFLLMSVAGSYMAISAANLAGVLNPNISDGVKWILIVTLGLATFVLCFLLRILLIKYDQVYSDITAIVVATSVLVFFSFLLISVDVFVLSNRFASYCVLAVSVGALAFGGYAIIDETRGS